VSEALEGSACQFQKQILRCAQDDSVMLFGALTLIAVYAVLAFRLPVPSFLDSTPQCFWRQAL
jgi:hypothetical protein